MQIYVFKDMEGDPLDDVYLYQIAVTKDSIYDDVAGYRNKTTIRVKSMEEKQRFVMVGNIPASLTPTLTEDVSTVRQLVEQMKFSGLPWRTPDNPEPFPMWGETTPYRISSTESPSFIGVDMQRALVKIEVGIDLNNPVAGDPALGFGSIFRIDSVYVCNVSDSGYIAPVTPSKALPSKISRVGYKFPATGNLLSNTIYVPESDTLRTYSPLNQPAFLVIKAYFYNQAVPTPYYYRLDFRSGDTYKALWRNTNYRMNITGIRTTGYLTLAEAQSAPLLSINPHLVVEGDGAESDINDIVYTDNYWMGCYSTDMKADWYNQPFEIPVGTSRPGGMKAELLTPASWITVPLNISSGLNTMICTLEDNFTGQPRTATIKLSAGTLSQLVKITQSPGSNTYIVRQGTAVKIPLTSANIDGVERSWTFVNNDAISYDMLTNNPVNPVTYHGFYIQTVFPAEGIYQIRVKTHLDEVWAWTVWVVGDNNFNTPLHYNGYSFMDRNLGALNNAPQGLYYQWGRKDPASPFLTQHPVGSLFDFVQPFINEKEISKYPTTFFMANSAPYDWMGQGQNNNLWSTIDGEKGPYDPCPFGWRVPVASNDAASPFDGFTNNMNGIYINPTHGYDGANYPGVLNTGKAIVWGATARGTSAYIYNVSDGTHGSARRVDAYPIRCVRDVKRIGY
jgi:hypothetical protein